MINQEKPKSSRKWILPLVLLLIVWIFAFYMIGNIPHSNSGVYAFSEGVTVGMPMKSDFAPILIPLLETGSSAPYSFYLGSGVGFPPMGLKLDINGVLKGTPTGTGDSKFQVCVKDVGGRSACRTYVMSVGPKSTTKTISNTNSASNNSNVSPATGFSGTWEGTAIHIVHGPVDPSCRLEYNEHLNLIQNGNELRGTVTVTVTKVISCGNLYETSPIGMTDTSPITGTVTGASAQFSHVSFDPNTGYGGAMDYTATVTGNTLSVKFVGCHSPDPRCTGDLIKHSDLDPGAYETILWPSGEFTATRTR